MSYINAVTWEKKSYPRLDCIIKHSSQPINCTHSCMCPTLPDFLAFFPLSFDVYIYILVNKDGHRNLFVHPRNKNGVRVESNKQSFMKLDGVALF